LTLAKQQRFVGQFQRGPGVSAVWTAVTCKIKYCARRSYVDVVNAGSDQMPLDPTILHHIADPGYQAVIEHGAVTAIDRQTGDRYRAVYELARLVGGSWKIDGRFRRDANRHDTGYHPGHW
jgi:hypothetical protein